MKGRLAMLAAPTTKLRTFMVFALVHNVPTFRGYVQAESHTHADKKAINLYGSGVWTKEK